MKVPSVGDYVLATKYHDGDPHDQFAVGFVSGMTWHGRFLVVDGQGKQFRANGFRRARKIDAEVGEFLVKNMGDIERGPKSLWSILRQFWIDRRKPSAPRRGRGER